MNKKWNEKRVLILGAARQGLALARFLAEHGAYVTLNDRAAPESPAMKKARQSLAACPQTGSGKISWVLGEHPFSLLDDIDLLCISGGVPLSMPIVVEARRRAIPFSNDTQIFMEHVPCLVAGITGSAGKTTTTSLTDKIMEALMPQTSFENLWVGGNIGVPLIDRVESIQPKDIVILEMSSFQLELMNCSPQISAILNITPNHLDRHGTLEAYTEAKYNILAFQNANHLAILCRDDIGSWQFSQRTQANLYSFGIHPPTGEWRGTCMRDDSLYFHDENQDLFLLKVQDIPLRGKHNLLNVLAACAIVCSILTYAEVELNSEIAGILQKVIQNFHSVPHRLELVTSHQGVKWYNDSIATTPERTMAAIHSFDEPIVLLLGGHDKALPWQELAELILKRVDHVITFGEAGELIYEQVKQVSEKPENKQKVDSQNTDITKCINMEEAVRRAANIAQSGDIVLLSPGAASFDEFIDFEERGERYRKLVKELTE